MRNATTTNRASVLPALASDRNTEYDRQNQPIWDLVEIIEKRLSPTEKLGDAKRNHDKSRVGPTGVGFRSEYRVRPTESANMGPCRDHREAAVSDRETGRCETQPRQIARRSYRRWLQIGIPSTTDRISQYGTL